MPIITVPLLSFLMPVLAVVGLFGALWGCLPCRAGQDPRWQPPGASRRFHSGYRETIRLDDQRPLQVRLIRPTDKPKLAEAFHHLSAESRYCRFLGHKNALTPQELRFFTECDGIDHLALGAFEWVPTNFQGDGALVGIARLIRCPDRPIQAEFALAVIDACQGLGLGRILLECLRAAAVELNIYYLEGQLLPANQKVQRLLHRDCWKALFRKDRGLVSVRLPTHTHADGIPHDV